MADQGQRTEKPTKRKLEKSRREGQFPASRELLAALQFLTFVVLLTAGGAAFFERTRDMEPNRVDHPTRDASPARHYEPARRE